MYYDLYKNVHQIPTKQENVLPFICILSLFYSCLITEKKVSLRMIPPKNNVHLRVLTLNVGHGRGKSIHQIFAGKNRMTQNIEQISRLLIESDADIVALQELDGPSIWSGFIDQVQIIGESSQYPYRFRGTHVQMPKLDYGTGILSQFPIASQKSVVFTPMPPLPQKGFVWIDVNMKKIPSGIRVVSLHLDFARATVREKQLATLSKSLQNTDRKLIVMGDYNMEWDSILKDFCLRHNLIAHKPKKSMITFPKTKKRLDWILISKEFSFVDYNVLPEHVSDHQAVLATIEILP
jgi:endonuclease/exonuclease/phosphatase family metal-dependent hydrolase